jgi:hypothetical protein
MESYKLTNVRENTKALVDDAGKLIRNIANFGLLKGQKAHRESQGEYYGFSIEATETIRPLLTDHAIKFMLDNYTDIDKIVRHFYLDQFYIKHGNSLIDYIICKFYEINGIDTLPKVVTVTDTKIDDTDLNQWIKSNRYDTICNSFKINGVGLNTKSTIVPEDWIDREFKNGFDLHSEIDKLEWRRNKPPCSYCCIYNMTILDDTMYIDSLDKLPNKNTLYDIIIINYDKDEIKTEIGNYTKTTLLKKVKLNSKHKVLVNDGLIIIYNKDIAVENPEYIKTDNVGYLASTLQKIVRRGPDYVDLIDIITKKMNDSKTYTLPEHNFAKITGSRQMMWRSFISIIEDACGFIKSEKMLDLKDLVLLSILGQKDLSIQFDKKIVELLCNTLKEVLYHSKFWNWRVEKEFIEESTIENSDFYYFAKKYMPMMTGDKLIINKVITLLNGGYKLDVLKVNKRPNKIIKDDEKLKVLCAGYDMHCKPNIMIHLQSEIDFIDSRDKYDTKKLAAFIWEYSSKINCRYDSIVKANGKDKLVLDKLYDVQKNYYQKYYTTEEDFSSQETKKIADSFKKSNVVTIDNITKCNSRYIFLLLFGQKIKFEKCEIFVCGTNECPIRIKTNNKQTKKMEFVDGLENKYLKYLDSLPGKCIKISKPILTEKFNWIPKLNKLSNFKLTCKSEKLENTTKYKFFVEDYEVFPFDCSNIIVPIKSVKGVALDKKNPLHDIIQMSLFNKKAICNLNLSNRELHHNRKEKGDFVVYNWKELSDKIDTDIWRKLYTKITMSDNNIVIGPVDRHGNKTYNSVDYTYEGVLLRLLNMLSVLYPNVIEPNSEFTFNLDKKSLGYDHLIHSLQELSYQKTDVKKEKDTVIKSKLWDHQQKSVSKFYDGLVKHGKQGLGDASIMGSGKTLVALSLMSQLHNNNVNTKYSGFLVLTPNDKLYDTWKDEINKHTDNFDCKLNTCKPLKKSIKRNSIVVSTLGRMRDHPINHNWIFVVIDECLSVQNKETLHTEEALRQIMSSQYGVLMLSATFFRSRFDKLYYMLKMLRTGLPLESKYLDTILNETIICNVSETNKSWYTTEHKLYLTDKQQKKYSELLEVNKKKTDEEKYSILVKYINNECDYIKYFHDKVKELEKQRKDCKILIFTKSKKEAEEISNDEIGLYPDITKRHVCVSYANGTYGLNNLVEFNTLLTRPPAPDNIPQMKGRLDRPGQKAKDLYLEYIYLDKTIEIGGIYKIAMANNFYDNYILPLSEFYKVALNGKF